MSIRYVVAIALGVVLFMQAIAVVPTRSEKAMSNTWLFERVLDKDEPVFSLSYGGVPFTQVLKTWAKDSRKEKIEGGTQHTQTWTDPKTKLRVACVAKAFDDSSALEWVVTLENHGPEPTPMIEGLRALDVFLPLASKEKFVLDWALGDRNSAESFAPKVEEIAPGQSRTLAPGGGCSTDRSLTFFNLLLGSRGFAMAVGWSGQWEATFRRQDDGSVHLQAGQQTTHFRLLPAEKVRTPRMLLVHWEGTDPTRGPNLFRQVLVERYMPRRNGKPVFAPVCGTVGHTAPDGSYEGPHLSVLPQLARVGVEVFWSDMDPQQWYPGGFPAGTGTWEVDRQKYPNGLEPIGDAAKRLGLEYLLWFEPERVQTGTKIHVDHPEFVCAPNPGTGLFRLDLPEARKYMFELLDGYVKRLHLGWIRWDFNMNPLGYWQHCDAPDRQGVTEMHYMEGLYWLWDELRANNPGLVIDQCAGGGRRIDLETLTRGVPLWHSDLQCIGSNPEADQLQNAGLFRWIPNHGCGNFGLEPSYAFRSAMTSGNILAASSKNGQLATSDRDSETEVRQTIDLFKRLRPLMLGDFYTLFPHVDAKTEWFGYQFDLAGRSGCAILFRRPDNKNALTKVALSGIDHKATYLVTDQDTKETKPVRGDELANLAVTIDDAPGSRILFYEKKEAQ